ncbi:MAG: phosphoglycerate kinase [Bacteroidetes bacterium 4572_112]|nr:MAG: phosphoglycerate kinase [Bacteroidetes bacterium 4572_112]
MKSIKQISLKDKTVIVRVDFNVPLNDNQEVTDNTRIIGALPTIKKLVSDGAAVILMSHLGRPKGEKNVKFSLQPVAKELSTLLGMPVKFVPEVLSAGVKKTASELESGEVMLLENLRFCPGETKGDEDMAKELASLADVYVNDAFGTAHRRHASTAVIAEYFPNDKYFGFLMEHEIVNLERALNTKENPYTAVIGGAKVSSKIDIIRNLIPKVDNMIIGGGMSFTFIKAMGGQIGGSLYEEDKLELAREILNEMILAGVNIYLPTDVVAADAFSNDANSKIVDSNNIPEGWMGLDIGPDSLKRFATAVKDSRMVLWNGPMGVFEMDKFSKGTKGVAIAVAAASTSGAFTAIGGGDSVAAINKYDLGDMLSYVSTGGGAMLEYLEGKTLPGIAAINE